MSKEALSRRELFALFRRAPAPEQGDGRAERMGARRLPRHLRPPLRPPGAVPEHELLDLCSRCGECAKACPVEAILPLGEEYGAWKGTPHILPRKAPCVLCEDLPCIAACPTTALRPLPAGAELRLGRAVIDPARCVAFSGTLCDDCAQACPEPLAILFSGREPRVDPAVCTGCGICEKVCPAEPAAICAFPFSSP